MSFIKSALGKIRDGIYWACFRTASPTEEQKGTAKALLFVGAIVSAFIVAAYYSEKYKQGSGNNTVRLLYAVIAIISAIAGFFKKKKKGGEKLPEFKPGTSQARIDVKPSWKAIITMIGSTLIGGFVYSSIYGIAVKEGILFIGIIAAIIFMFGSLIPIVLRKPPKYAVSMFLTGIMIFMVVVFLTPAKD